MFPLVVSFHPALQTGRHVLLREGRALNQADHATLAQAGAVLLPLACRPDLYQAVRAAGPPLFPRQDPHHGLDGKVGNHRLFASLDLPRPAAREFPDLASAQAAWQGGELPWTPAHDTLVAKGAGGGEGRNVFLVHGPSELAALGPTLSTHCPRGPSGLVLQEYLPQAGDLRVILLGHRAPSFWRVPAPGEFRANLAQGGSWRPADPDREPGAAAAVELTRRLGRLAHIDIAAVDLLLCPRRGPLLSEINFYFGRQALGGCGPFWDLMLGAAREWLADLNLDPELVWLA